MEYRPWIGELAPPACHFRDGGLMTERPPAPFCPIEDEWSMSASVALTQSGVRGGWFLSFR